MSFNLFRWITAEVSLGFQIQQVDRPLVVLIFGHIFPELSRMLIFTFFAYMAGGESVLPFVAVGVAVVATYRASLSEPSDYPVTDAMLGLSQNFTSSGAAVFFRYCFRSVPLAVLAAVDSLIAIAALSLLIPSFDLFLSIMTHWWIVLPTIFSATMFSITFASFAVGNAYLNLIHNTTSSIAIVCSGAFFSLANFPVLAYLGAILPGFHSVSAMRQATAGSDPWLNFTLEILVGALWAAVGIALYSYHIHKAKKHGRGVFA